MAGTYFISYSRKNTDGCTSTMRKGVLTTLPIARQNYAAAQKRSGACEWTATAICQQTKHGVRVIERNEA